MKSMVKVLVLALLAAFVFTSCAKAPTQQMDQAKAAVQAVQAAKGDVYAKDELAKLKTDLQAALDEVNAQSKKFFKKYGKAKEMLAKVVSDADAVKAEIPARIEKAKEEATQAMNDAKASFDAATALLEKAPKGKGTKKDIEAMKADLAGLQSQMTEAQNAMTAEDYFGAKDKATAIKAKADDIAKQVQEAINKVKGKR
jgi:uncharacterized coiled-coil DUF342 family protein